MVEKRHFDQQSDEVLLNHLRAAIFLRVYSQLKVFPLPTPETYASAVGHWEQIFRVMQRCVNVAEDMAKAESKAFFQELRAGIDLFAINE